jgi:hypothetical protein
VVDRLTSSGRFTAPDSSSLDAELRFAVLRPGNPKASPRSHGMPCRDVSSCVHVSVLGVSARPACEDGLALTRPRIDGPARRAALGCVGGIDFLDRAPGLILQPTGQQPPAAGQYPSVEPSLLPDIPSRLGHRAFGRASHVGDPQVLEADQVVTAGEIGRGLLTPVFSQVNPESLQPRNLQFDAGASMGATLGTRQSALQQHQAALQRRTQPWHSQQLSGGQGGGHDDTPVYSYDFAITRRRDGRGDNGEGNVPAACAVAGNSVRLNPSGDGPGPAEPKPPGLGHPHLGRMARQAAETPSLRSDDLKALIAPSLPPGGPAMGTGEEIEHCPGEVPQRLLLNGLRSGCKPSEFPAGSGELAALGKVPGRRRTARAPVLVLLHGEIPHESGVRAVLPQDQFLPRSRREPVTGHKSNLLANTDTSEEVTRRSALRRVRMITPRPQ